MFVGLPAPSTTDCSIYVLGPGFGESQVIVAPGPVTVVVDSCRGDGDTNLTLALLDHLKVATVDLLVVTHPDLDHVAGLAELIERRPPAHAWRYPFAGTLRDLVAKWLRTNHADHRLQEVHDALVGLDKLQESNVAFEVGYGARDWHKAGLSLTCLAPTPRDQMAARKPLEAAVQAPHGNFELQTRLARYLEGDKRSLGDRPNLVSLALALRWETHRVVLGGDVSTKASSPRAGWAGILGLLREEHRLDLVTDASLVKVSHHGSRDGHHSAAWVEHARNRKTTAVVTPFKHGSVQLPNEGVLQDLRTHVGTLTLTSDAGACQQRASDAGWKARPTPRGAGLSCVAAVLAPSGGVTLHVGGSAQSFT